jgi:hypothetical protein
VRGGGHGRIAKFFKNEGFVRFPLPTFSEKILLSGKNFLGGPWNGRGPKFWNTPPNQKPVGTALAKSKFKE